MLNNEWKQLIKSFDYAFQPIVNINNGKIYAVEALIRNYERDFTIIFEIFDKAYNENMLYDLDLELREIVIKKFSNININNLKLFYNLDNRLLNINDFDDSHTVNLLNKYNLSKNNLCFELSEKDTLQNSNNLLNLLDVYKEHGYNIAIDDFGIGVSGLKLMYFSEASFIKIDQFFIRNIHTDAKKRLFCSSIINMAHIMGSKVIAEGIEDEKEYYVCKEIGFDFLQGYLIQKAQLDIKYIEKKYKIIDDLVSKDKRLNDKNILSDKYIQDIKSLNINDSLYNLFVYFKNNPSNTFVPIINDESELEGVINELDIKDMSYSQYGLALAKNLSQNSDLKRYLKSVHSVELSWGVDKTLEVYNMNTGNKKGIFITKANKYYGFISVDNLLTLSYKRNIEIAKDQNPLSKLPGNNQIEQRLELVFSTYTENTYHIVYFDFNDFKPFNDSYGFRQGDRAILIFSELLKKHFEKEAFIAHIGGDDFFALFKNKDYEFVYKKSNLIINKFKDTVKDFYDKKDKEREYIKIQDRFGIKRKFKLLSVAAAIIEINKNSQIKNFDQIISIMKKQSKLTAIALGSCI